MTYLQALLLGVIQGLTEFLPISSSGHLVIGQHFLGLRQPELFFDVSVHFATLIAVLVYFRSEVLKLVRGAFIPRETAGRKTLLLIILGTVPAVIVGFTLNRFMESAFGSPKMASVMLLLTGVILLTTIPARPRGKKLWSLKWLDAVLVGIAQAAAIMPGISRSGATIAASLHLGIERDDAARFSFLLSIPAILGAAVYEGKDVSAVSSDQLLVVLTGMLAAGIVGYAAIHIMLKIVSQGRLHFFAPYCIALGMIVFFLT